METAECLQVRMSVHRFGEGRYQRGEFCRSSLQSCAKVMSKYRVFLLTVGATDPVCCMKLVSSQECFVETVTGLLDAGTCLAHGIKLGLSCVHGDFAVSGMCGSVLITRSLTILHRCSKLNLKCVMLGNSWYVCPGLPLMSLVTQLKLVLLCPGLVPTWQMRSEYNIY